jgi:quinol monooxygenase YgiN
MLPRETNESRQAMGTIRAHTAGEYVTLINLFTVNPRDQLGLTRVQLGDMYWYGKRQPDALSANFHRSLDGVRFFNYGQWRSARALEEGRRTPEFQQHLRNYRYFDMSPDPHLYEVVMTTRGAPLEIRWPSPVLVTLRVDTVEPARQEALVALLREELASEVEGRVGAALHRALDGERVAVYTQWRGEAELEAALATAGQRTFQERAASLVRATDFRRYEVSGTSED